jgi:sugar/nucleoside kinase (ribokinase family)
MFSDGLLAAGTLCVVGNINRDIKTTPLAPTEQLFRDGETQIGCIKETVGGGGANSACAAAALGARVGFLGKVGADPLGVRLEQCLRRQGISCHLAMSNDHPTGTSINLTYTSGQRHFLSCLPNNQSLSPADLDFAALHGYRHLYRADVWFSSDMLFGGNQELFQFARRAGMEVSLDLNWDPLWGSAETAKILERKKAVRTVLPWVTVAHGNVEELNEFADSADLERTLNLLTDWGVQSVVVHMGDQGAGYFQSRTLTVEPAVPTVRRMNTTGTGDVLSVCMMLLHHHNDISIPDRLRLSNSIVSEFIEDKRQLIPSIS